MLQRNTGYFQISNTLRRIFPSPPPFPRMLPNRIELVKFVAALPLSRVWCRCVLQKYEKMQITVKVVQVFGCSLQPCAPPTPSNTGRGDSPRSSARQYLGKRGALLRPLQMCWVTGVRPSPAQSRALQDECEPCRVGGQPFTS